MVSKESLAHSIVILSGTTASGKTDLSVQWARENPKVEIINADSLLVYRGMDIGTDKPSPDIREEIPHHLIDIRNPDETYHLGAFVEDVWKVINDVHKRNKKALIVGGTGFYLKGLIYGTWANAEASYEIRTKLETFSNAELKQMLFQKDPKHADKVHENDRYRLIRAMEFIEKVGKTVSQKQKENIRTSPHPDLHLFVIDRPQEELEKRIQMRCESMIEKGLIEEVEKMMRLYPESKPLSSVGYLQTYRYLKGIKPPGRNPSPGIKGLKNEIFLATRKLVKKQRTWFRGQAQAEWFYREKDDLKIWDKLNALYHHH